MSDEAYKVNPWHLAGHWAALYNFAARYATARTQVERDMWDRAWMRQIAAFARFHYRRRK